MKKIKISEIRTEADDGTDLVVEGGWRANVIEIEPRSESEIAPYVRYYQRQGLRPGAARLEALKLAQALFEAEYIRRLRNSLRRWIREYYEKAGSLDGFDPEAMQNAFVPGENFGRAGNDLAWELMEEMRENGTLD